MLRADVKHIQGTVFHGIGDHWGSYYGTYTIVNTLALHHWLLYQCSPPLEVQDGQHIGWRGSWLLLPLNQTDLTKPMQGQSWVGD